MQNHDQETREIPTKEYPNPSEDQPSDLPNK